MLNLSMHTCGKAAGLGHNSLLDLLRKQHWIVKTKNGTGHVLSDLGRSKGLLTQLKRHPSPACQHLNYSVIIATRGGHDNIVALVAAIESGDEFAAGRPNTNRSRGSQHEEA